ncbi:MAG: mandelate racemase/muconate lactonizing enzyme family protein [Trueperaceae bacterium]|nr:mandelate racemase/muconate lactonizing enzyme family protein [Trueperaceae bacterium]
MNGRPEVRITEVRGHVLLAPDSDASLTSSAQDSFLVVIDTDAGVTGVGEADVNPWIAKACLSAPGTHTMGRSLQEVLIAQDPRETDELWRRMYIGSAMNGRRGAVIHAMSAVDMALWDIRGKLAGQPVHELLGGPVHERMRPYASLQPVGTSFEEYRDSLCEWAARACELGFQAVKAEVTMSGPYAHSGLHESYDRHTEVVAAVRDTIGPDVTLMVDVQYMWPDAATALSVLRDWEAFDLYMIETPVWSDDLDGYAELAASTSIPVAAGEWLATRWEFEALMDRGRIAIAQPDVSRVGGFTEAMIVARMAEERGLTIVPHCWKTGVSSAATAHFAFATSACAFIEYLPPQLCVETLRKELAQDNIRIDGGAIVPPTAPGLGVDVDWDAVRRFEVG